MISSSELKNFQNELMSPPITPKLMNDTSSTISTTFTNTTISTDDRLEEDELMSLLPPSSKSLNDDHHYNKRKEKKLGLSIHSIKLVNQDENDFYGKRFNFSNMIQPLHDDQQKKNLHRRKSLPYKSPSKTSYNHKMIFKMDVYHRPLKENNDLLLSTSLPTHSSFHPYYTSMKQQEPIMIPSNQQQHQLDYQHKKNNRKLSLSISSSHSSSFHTLSSPISPIHLHSIEKPKADTQFYDQIDLSIEDKYIFDSSWIPLWKHFDHRSQIRVVWKGSPLMIHQLPYYHELHSNESSIASTLRLSPEQYLKCKRALILTAKVFYDHGIPFRKSDAQKVCRIDVNKTSCLWNAFNRLGWFQPR